MSRLGEEEDDLHGPDGGTYEDDHRRKRPVRDPRKTGPRPRKSWQRWLLEHLEEHERIRLGRHNVR